jgi:Fe-S-cluster formation regulator IscX/YfhJ
LKKFKSNYIDEKEKKIVQLYTRDLFTCHQTLKELKGFDEDNTRKEEKTVTEISSKI